MNNQLIITLPAEAVELVRQKVQSGAYSSEAEVIAEGLRALQDRDASLEQWLREDVVPGHAEYLADPSFGIPAEDLLHWIQQRRSAQT